MQAHAYDMQTKRKRCLVALVVPSNFCHAPPLHFTVPWSRRVARNFDKGGKTKTKSQHLNI